MKSYCELENTIQCICNYEYEFFLNKPNVVGLGLGYKIKDGLYTCQKCITVFVKRKLPLNQINSREIIPDFYKYIPTDVIEIGIVRTCSLRKKVRPTLGGYSIGVKDFEAGSMGCLVADSNNDYILTNNHIVAKNSEESEGKEVLQPASQYGGKQHRDVVGYVYDFDRVILDGSRNFTDSAIVETDREKSSIDIAFIGPPLGIKNPSIGESVQKVGATTELTKGTIRDRYVTIEVNFLGRNVIFKNQITTTKMSDEGDSGAVLLNKRRECIGLLMADTESISIFNDINYIVSKLHVHILRR